MAGRSIRIFLVDGSTSGIRTAELGLSTIKALAVPRASLATAASRQEFSKTGVYVLLGDDPDTPGVKGIYIGETDTISTRISTHNRELDFWDECVVFVSKDSNLTKAHVRFLEARLIQIAKSAKRATVENNTSPSERGLLPESDEAEMEEFIVQAQLLLGSLGYNIFQGQPMSQVTSAETNQQSEGTQLGETESHSLLFEYAGSGFNATFIVDTDTGTYIVRRGSTSRKEEAASLQQTYRSLRRHLVDSGVVVETDNQTYVFMQDYAFPSPTAAAQAVSGYSVSGKTAWKSQSDQKPLADWLESQLPSEQEA